MMTDPIVPGNDQVYYGGEVIVEPEQRWTDEEKLKLLDWHPMFTGRCPRCETPILRSPWVCDHCGWEGDSVLAA